MNRLETRSFNSSEKGSSRRTLEEVRQSIFAESYFKPDEVPSTSAKATLDWYKGKVEFSADNDQISPENVAALEALVKQEEEQMARSRQKELTRQAMDMPEQLQEQEEEEPTQEIAMPQRPEQARTQEAPSLSGEDVQRLAQIRDSIREGLYASRDAVPVDAFARAILKTYWEQVAFDSNNADLLSEEEVADLEKIAVKEEGVRG